MRWPTTASGETGRKWCSVVRMPELSQESSDNRHPDGLTMSYEEEVGPLVSVKLTRPGVAVLSAVPHTEGAGPVGPGVTCEKECDENPQTECGEESSLRTNAMIPNRNAIASARNAMRIPRNLMGPGRDPLV
jgi:hypothetical protein